MFLFKKHLFFDDYINLDDPVEKELLYHQVLHSLRSERFPISEIEAIMLTALQGQLETSDCGEVIRDYRVIASHCLPPRFVPNIPHEAVAMHHQSLRGMLPAEAKKSFLNLIQSWPLHRATIFDVMVSEQLSLDLFFRPTKNHVINPWNPLGNCSDNKKILCILYALFATSKVWSSAQIFENFSIRTL